MLVVLADDDPRGDDRARALGELGRDEQLAVELERGLGEVRVEVVGEDERDPERAGDPRAAVGRAEHPQLGNRVLAGDRADRAVAVAEEAAQLRELLGKLVGVAAAQDHRRALVGAGRPAEAEVDAPGIERLQQLNRSATISGAWFGSITPPDPTRIRR